MIKIQRLSTASFKITSPKGKVIMLDPWLVGDPLWPADERELSKLAEINIIIVTHAHFDHVSGVEEICKANPAALVICQFELALSFMAKGLKNVYPLNKGGTAVVDNIKFSMVGADHTSSFLDEKGGYQYAGSPCGFVIEMEDGFKVYAAGDTGLTADMKTIIGDFFKPDLAILPALGTMVMEPEQAVFAVGLIKPKYVIPSHDFPEKFSQAASPEGYEALSQKFPIVLGAKQKTVAFSELMRKKHRRVKVIALNIKETTEIK
ncbi:MAG: metal-dependent hydrolase [Patescibacteria group bacterium]